MKRAFICSLLCLTAFSVAFADDLWIKADQVITEDVKVVSGNVRIGDGAELHGNIFIEEGDLFIGSEVDIVGSITIKKGSIFIKEKFTCESSIRCEQGTIDFGIITKSKAMFTQFR